MKLWNDFKNFAFKGNIIDLAIGLMIGAAFNKIVSALVNDIVMPLIAVLTGKGQKFTDMFIVLGDETGQTYESLEQARTAGVNVLAWGNFIQTVVDFLIIAAAIFFAVNATRKIREKQAAAPEPAKPAGPSSTDQLLMEIRDELKKNNTRA